MNHNGGTIISFAHSAAMGLPSPPVHSPSGNSTFTFQLASAASKKGANTAEKRANHNAVERARRECLNTKFQELAHALPSLSQVRRPSKSVIVQKSLDFIYTARQKDDKHDKEMRAMRSENESLRDEINRLRKSLNLPPLPPREEPEVKSSPIVEEPIDDMKQEDTKSDDGSSAGTDDDFDTHPAHFLFSAAATAPQDFDLFNRGFAYDKGVQTLCQPFAAPAQLFQNPPYGHFFEMADTYVEHL